MPCITGTANGIRVSSDLKSWAPIPGSSNDLALTAFMCDGTFGFVENVASSGKITVFTSNDPTLDISEWNAVEISTPADVSINRFFEDGSRWILLDVFGYIFLSEDKGNTWVARRYSSDNNYGYGITKHGDKYVIVGSSFIAWSSLDLVSWSHEIIGGTFQSQAFTDVASNGNEICAVNDNGEIWTATTLGEWSLSTSLDGIYIMRIKWLQDVFVAADSFGRVIYRTGGSWITSSVGFVAVVNDFTYDLALSKWVVVIRDGRILTSPNFVTWVEESQTGESTYSIAIGSVEILPPPYQLLGCSFQGFDRDATVTITRQIQVQESEGGSVTLIPTAPAQFDSWDIEVGLRVSAAQAQAIEASLPPYGTPIENALRLPPRGGGASFPGLLPLTPGDTYDLYAYPMSSPLDVQGRVAIGTDLFSYRMSLRFFAAHQLGINASPTNIPTATTTTAPEWLTGKAITHSVVDPSTSIPTISRFGASTAVSTNFHPTKQGRTNKRTITLDCLSQDRVDELVGFFRGVRHNPTTITLDNGASGFEAVSVYLTALSFTRGDGLYWTGSLEVVLA